MFKRRTRNTRGILTATGNLYVKKMTQRAFINRCRLSTTLFNRHMSVERRAENVGFIFNPSVLHVKPLHPYVFRGSFMIFY